MSQSGAPLRAPPDHLYKYRSMDGPSLEFTKDIVVGSNLYFANPISFNDPFDQFPAVSVESTPEERALYYREIADNIEGAPAAEKEKAYRWFMSATDEELLENSRRALIETNSMGSMCSLSARNDSVLMWSHYAANHTGICLRFAAPPGSMFALAGEVRYQRERPVINRIKMSKPQPDLAAWLDALLTKADFWSYEEEWRVLRTLPAGIVPFPPQQLNGLILGARVTAQTVQALRDWMQERKAPLELFWAVPCQATFRLEIVPLD